MATVEQKEAHDLVPGDIMASNGMPIVSVEPKAYGLIGIRYLDNGTGLTHYIVRDWFDLVGIILPGQPTWVAVLS